MSERQSIACTTVLFHGIRDRDPVSRWDTFGRFNPSIDQFRRQVRWLTRTFQPVTLAQCIAHVRHGDPLPRRALLITFDDGFASLAGDCLSVLSEHDASAVVFVLSGVLDRSHLPWFVPFDRLMRVLPRGRISWRGTTHDVESLAGLSAFSASFKEAIYGHPSVAHRSLVSELAEENGLAPELDALFAWDGDDMAFMDRADLRRWSSAGMAIGAHSHTHASMAWLQGEELRDEIVGSGDRLRALGLDIHSFAYPDGRWSEGAAGLVEESYAIGFAVHVDGTAVGPASVRRVPLGCESPRDLWHRFRNPPRPLRWVEERTSAVLTRLGAPNLLWA